jgi:hypothetical protein
MYSKIIKKPKKDLKKNTEMVQFSDSDADTAMDILGDKKKSGKSDLVELEIKLQSAKKKK